MQQDLRSQDSRSQRATRSGQSFRRALLAWFEHARRDLPWRRTADPYRIWVSEVMLQQTRAEVVGPYYERFLAAFPGLIELADAPLDEVLTHWAGLGYYRRARALHSAVAECKQQYGGDVPRDPAAFAALSGVGPYTTAAVLSIAFGTPLAAVDGNVIRVLARWYALPGHARSPTLIRRVRKIADALLDRERPGDHNQAMMELGATICTPRNPRCDDCPVSRGCMAVAGGAPERWPKPAPRAVVRRVVWYAAWIERRGRVLFALRGETGRMQGLWELPWSAMSAEQVGCARDLDLTPGPAVATIRHSILDERITVYVHSAQLNGAAPRTGYRWLEPAAIGAVATSSVWRKAARAMAGLKDGHEDGVTNPVKAAYSSDTRSRVRR